MNDFGKYLLRISFIKKLSFYCSLIACFFFSCDSPRKLENAFSRSIGKKEIDLSYCGLKEFPARLFDYPQIETIYLHHNKITSIPYDIFRLKNLKRLFIGNNKLNNLPNTICEIENLEVLSIRANDFYELPEILFQISNLKYLDISHNQLNILPQEIGNLTSLTHLFLDFNYLIKIPSEIGNLKKLQIFSIGKNQINYVLPKELENLEDLFSLNVAFCGNGIEVPRGICKLQKLEYLYIDNQTILPGSINQNKFRLKVIQKVNP